MDIGRPTLGGVGRLMLSPQDALAVRLFHRQPCDPSGLSRHLGICSNINENHENSLGGRMPPLIKIALITELQS